jgi:hypothetical protein
MSLERRLRRLEGLFVPVPRQEAMDGPELRIYQTRP